MCKSRSCRIHPVWSIRCDLSGVIYQVIYAVWSIRCDPSSVIHPVWSIRCDLSGDIWKLVQILIFFFFVIVVLLDKGMWKNSIYVVFVIDVFVTLILIIDLYRKLARTNGVISKKHRNFDTFLVCVHVLSLVTHVSKKIQFYFSIYRRFTF